MTGAKVRRETIKASLGTFGKGNYNTIMSSSSLPLVSVLIPSYNYAHTLEEALSSVFSQTYPRYELIAVDDGSSDGSRDILDSWKKKHPSRMVVLEHQGSLNKGIAETYRLALNRAKGELTAFIEADDVWLPGNLERKVLAYLNTGKKAGVIYSRYRAFGKTRPALYWRLYEVLNWLGTPGNRLFDSFPVLLKRNGPATFSNFLIETELLRALPFPEARELYYDWWVLAHAAARKPFLFLPEKLISWRIHSASANFALFDRVQLKMLFAFFTRLYKSLGVSRLTPANVEILEKNADKMERQRFFAEKGELFKFFYTRISLDPWDGLRFLAHVSLKNILVS